MTGLEALNKIVNNFAEYYIISQHQYLNATNLQTAVEFLARSEECRTIEKSLKALEIIKRFTWIEDGKLKCGRYADIEIELEEDDFESKEELDLLKEVLE